ncbi:GumC family protein [Daejeonella oryzae]|uniref:GumC family protein n=1 Tax=Daejeonella oryzae TaxID=1122943 RepID=UPI000565D51B|nr:tyrosine-protein kinase family protein [Daejeonella oryzae]
MSYSKLASTSGIDKDQFLNMLSGYLKYWYIFLACITLSLTAAYFYLKTKTPAYNISSTLFIEVDKKGEGVMQGTAFSDLDMFTTTVTVDNEIEALRSRALLQKVLTQLNMGTSYFVEGTFKRSELYGSELPFQVQILNVNSLGYQKEYSIKPLSDSSFELSDGDNVKSYRFGDLIKTPEYSIKVVKDSSFTKDFEPVFIQFKNLSKLAEQYSKTKLQIAPISQESNTIVLSLVDPIPQRGVDVLSKLIETYNLENINHKNKLALNTIQFIDNRLKYLGGDLSSAGQDVEKYKQENMVTDVGSDAQQNLQLAGEYSQQLNAVTVQKSVVESLEKYVNSPASRYELVPSTLGLSDATLNDLTEKYNNLQIERQRLLRTAQPDNPLVININEQLSGLKSNISENLKNIKRGLTITQNNLSSNTSKFESRIRTAPTLERGLSERNREQGVKEGLYNYLLQKREETALSLSATLPTSRVVDEPAADSGPVSPKVSFIYLIAFLLGLAIPASGIFVKDLLNTKVQNLEDVEHISGALILGELSHKDNDGSMVINKSSRTTISELFRYIRSNLNYMTDNKANKVMLITSSMKGEGKTFFSVNLGATLSLVDKKVVLLEFDLRKPDLLNNLNIKHSEGITNYLNSEVSLDDIIQPSNYQPNLSVIGCGPIPENPAELLMSAKMPEFFEQLRERFDYIIIDTSPVGQVADAFSLAPYVDSSIYLVRYNYTDKAQLNILKDIFDNNKLKNPMVVLNDSKGDNFKGYGYGGYGYATSEKKAYS